MKTEPRELPIPFSAAMVVATRRAIAPKTQTRRRFRDQTIARDGEDGPELWTGFLGWQPAAAVLADPSLACKACRCPYGAVGDRLWVREAWRVHRKFDAIAPRDLPRDVALHFEADGPGHDWLGKLRPAMFLPRWASRYVLEIVEAPRVERLQDISEADCIAEGCLDARSVKTLAEVRNDLASPDVIGIDGRVYSDARAAYRGLWDGINGKDGPRSWHAIGFVWVVTFRRLEPAELVTARQIPALAET